MDRSQGGAPGLVRKPAKLPGKRGGDGMDRVVRDSRVIMRKPSHLLALLAVPLAAACIPAEEGAPDDVAVLESSSAMTASFDLMNVSGGFAALEALGLLPVGLARVRALQDAVQGMVAMVRDPACVTVETDEESFVEVRFDACPAGLLRQREIDGSLRADLDFETAPCGLDECPVAALYTLSTPRLRIGARLGVRFMEIAGSWALRAPVAPDEPSTWTAGFMMTNHLGRSQP
jgi:hypothetical protein